MDPSSSTSSSRASGLPKAGLATLLIVIFIEWVVYQPGWNVLGAARHEEAVVASKVLYTEVAPDADYLFLGDSVATTEFDCELLTRRFSLERQPLTFVNLGLVGSASAAGNYFILERYLQNHPRPQGVILVFSPWTLSYRDGLIEWIGRMTRYFNRVPEIAEYAPILGLDSACRSVLQRMVPSSRWSGLLEKTPTPQIAYFHDPRLLFKKRRHFYQQTVSRYGFTPVSENATLQLQGLGLQMDNLNRLFMQKIIDRLKQDEIEIYFAYAPLPESHFKALQEQPDARREREQYLKELGRQGVKSFPIPPWLPDDQFGSSLHLREDAAVKFSEQLQRDLKRLFDQESTRGAGVDRSR